jgi:hypothetical protein
MCALIENLREISQAKRTAQRKAQRKFEKHYFVITMSINYEQKLLQEIITGNYQLGYIITRKKWEL